MSKIFKAINVKETSQMFGSNSNDNSIVDSENKIQSQSLEKNEKLISIKKDRTSITITESLNTQNHICNENSTILDIENEAASQENIKDQDKKNMKFEQKNIEEFRWSSKSDNKQKPISVEQ